MSASCACQHTVLSFPTHPHASTPTSASTPLERRRRRGKVYVRARGGKTGQRKEEDEREKRGETDLLLGVEGAAPILQVDDLIAGGDELLSEVVALR
eukprot:1484196-Rhodomonas_salina.1